MSEAIFQLRYLLPINWRLTAIVFDFNRETWEVTAWSDDLTHAVMKQAPTIDEAFEMAHIAILEEDYWAPRAERSRLATAASDILSIMGLGKAKPQAPVKRRVIPNG